MVTLFSREHGRVSFAARGAHRAGSPHLASTTPFCLGEYLLQERSGGYTLKGCTLDKTHYALRESPVHLSCAALCAQLILEELQPGEANAALFSLFLQALAYFESHVEEPLGLVAGFLLRFAGAIGQGMRLGRCAVCGGPLRDARFDFEQGGTVCAAHAAPGSPVATKALILALAAGMRGERLLPVEGVGRKAYALAKDYIEFRLERRFPGFAYLEALLP
jgi:DNA repair protein RecO (recombination protein O)